MQTGIVGVMALAVRRIAGSIRFKRVALFLGLLGLGGFLLWVRGTLRGINNPDLEAWPSQVIFGYYFTIIVLAARPLANKLRMNEGSAEQNLLLLAMACLSGDLVLNNISEAGTARHPDASYGIVLFWDTLTFFVWLWAVDLCSGKNRSHLQTSLVIASVPAFKLCREVLLLPYAGEGTRPWLDLAFGDFGLSVSWLFLLIFLGSSQQAGTHRAVVMLRRVVAATCFYWVLSLAESTWSLVHVRSAHAMYSALATGGIPSYGLNLLYLAVSALAVSQLAASKSSALSRGLGLRHGAPV